MRFRLYLREMRVHHYIKNLLIFLPLFFGGQILCARKFSACAAGFFSFSFLSSAVYIVNDILDAEKDALHPVKCRRPVASGAVSKNEAAALAVLLCLAGFAPLLFLRPATALLVASAYLALNFCYSLGLKNIPILDLAILSSGFVLRIVLGSALSGVQISLWLYLVVFTGSLCFAFGKRRGEIQRPRTVGTRKVLEFYTEKFLDKNMYLCMTLADTFYALWAMESARSGGKVLIAWTFPVVLLITMKYSLDVEKDGDGDPVEVLFHDRALMALCAGYAALMFFGLYSK